MQINTLVLHWSQESVRLGWLQDSAQGHGQVVLSVPIGTALRFPRHPPALFASLTSRQALHCSSHATLQRSASPTSSQDVALWLHLNFLLPCALVT